MPAQLTLDLRDMASLTAQEMDQWNSWALADPDLGSPYFRAEYALIAATVCPQSGLGVFKRGDQVVGYFPFQRRGATVQPLGAPMNDYHGVIGPGGVRPSFEEVAACFGAAVFSASSWVGEGEGLSLNPSYRADLTQGQSYEDWYASRRTAFGKYFKDKERARRSFEVAMGPLKVETHVMDENLLDDLIALKRAQYRRSGLHDIFACGWTVDLLKALMRSPYPNLVGVLCVLKAEGKVCALEYALAAGPRYHFWFPAYCAEIGRFSPGIILSLETIRLMSERGFTQFDYGTGSDGYKRYFCDTVQMVGEGQIDRSPVMGLCAKGMQTVMGPERARRLSGRIRRRWHVIESCETRLSGRAVGVVQAVRSSIKSSD